MANGCVWCGRRLDPRNRSGACLYCFRATGRELCACGEAIRAGRNQCRACYLKSVAAPKERGVRVSRTHCRRGHELTAENVYQRRTYRQCKLCKAISSKARNPEKHRQYDRARWQELSGLCGLGGHRPPPDAIRGQLVAAYAARHAAGLPVFETEV